MPTEKFRDPATGQFVPLLGSGITQADADTRYIEKPGVIKMYGGDAPPPGYLTCMGQSVTQFGYPALYAVIGTKFGVGDGDGYSFSLPDMRARMPIGVSATNPDPQIQVVGKIGGTNVRDSLNHYHNNGSLTTPDHYHTLNDAGGASIVMGTSAVLASRRVGGVSFTEGYRSNATAGTPIGGQTNATPLQGAAVNSQHSLKVSGTTDWVMAWAATDAVRPYFTTLNFIIKY